MKGKLAWNNAICYDKSEGTILVTNALHDAVQCSLSTAIVGCFSNSVAALQSLSSRIVPKITQSLSRKSSKLLNSAITDFSFEWMHSIWLLVLFEKLPLWNMKPKAPYPILCCAIFCFNNSQQFGEHELKDLCTACYIYLHSLCKQAFAGSQGNQPAFQKWWSFSRMSLLFETFLMYEGGREDRVGFLHFTRQKSLKECH